MKTRFYVLIFLMGVISSISSCSDDEVTPVLDVHAQSGNLVMEPQANAQLDIHLYRHIKIPRNRGILPEKKNHTYIQNSGWNRSPVWSEHLEAERFYSS